MKPEYKHNELNKTGRLIFKSNTKYILNSIDGNEVKIRLHN